MRKSDKYSEEVRGRAVQMVLKRQSEYASQWATIESLSGKFGCTAETLRREVRQAERDQGKHPGPTTTECADQGGSESFVSCDRLMRSCARQVRIFARAEFDRRPKS